MMNWGVGREDLPSAKKAKAVSDLGRAEIAIGISHGWFY